MDRYEEIYLKAYSGGRAAKADLAAYFQFYNTQSPHQALSYRTPAEVFSGDSAKSDKQTKERRSFAETKVVSYAGATGLSLNLVPLLSK